MQQFLPPVLLLVLLTTSPHTSHAADTYTLDGEAAWDHVFSSRQPVNVVPKHSRTSGEQTISFIWTEGPLFVKKNNTLLFSDTQLNKIFEWAIGSEYIGIYANNTGDPAPGESDWRGEVGSNGLALTPDGDVLVCQHGAHRLVKIDSSTGHRTPIAAQWDGKGLNGPNDVITRVEDGKTFAYFTDPPYAWQEKSRPGDLPYLEAAVVNKGPGDCSVYRVGVSPQTEVQKLFSMVQVIT